MSANTPTEKAVPPPPETVETETTRVVCDGDGPLGHPRVYLEIGVEAFVDCPYCDRRFVLKAGAGRH